MKHDNADSQPDNNVDKLVHMQDSRFLNLNAGQFGSAFNPSALSQLTQQSPYDYRRGLVKSEEMLQNSLSSDHMGLRSSGLIFSLDSHAHEQIKYDDAGNQNVVRTRRRKTGIKEEERVCVVCAEPASGYNFDRLTCESCKAFFRRNALKPRDKIKKCNRGGICNIEGNQRKHCPSCRLEKCLASGMKKELILPPEKLEQRAKPRRRKNPSQNDDVASVNSTSGGNTSALDIGGPTYNAHTYQQQQQAPTSPVVSSYGPPANGDHQHSNNFSSSLAFAMAAIKQPNVSCRKNIVDR
ncbi:receptor [Cichlidogyrus casuarinus]|uniref:Receptor n=1 Tax=Cichlidogyrus casuarinus TaxID=1844966 RepID=A0ABD2Q9D0_9PLAT